MKGSDVPYLLDYYNVCTYYSSSKTSKKKTLSRFVNTFITAFNKREKLPKYIFVICDKDILEAMAPLDHGVPEGLEKAFNYLARQLDRLILARKDQLQKRRLGAVQFDPKIIWVKMIK